MRPWIVAYDLGTCPASWDFVNWLMNVEIMRRAANGGPLKVRFIPGPMAGFRADRAHRPLKARSAIFENVMLPALQLVGAERTEERENEHSPSYLIKYSAALARVGNKIPYWTVPDEPMERVARILKIRGRQPIVITLREASYYPERNSNLAAWIEWAKACGESVVFVRDTAKADEPLPDPRVESAPFASKDFLLRAALMAQAKANLMVGNGPIALAHYMPVPWLMFNPCTPHLPTYRPGRPESWEKLRIGFGGQIPWATEQQRIVWADDTLENISAAWKSINGKPDPRLCRKIMVRNALQDTLISSEYLELQRGLHANKLYGISSRKWSNAVSELAQIYQCADILDYGCGKGRLKDALGAMVHEYDPAIAGKDADPAPADLVACTDVLEHIEPDKLDNVLAHLAGKVKKAAFLTVALRPAKKVLADGRNAHLIQESGDWWLKRLSQFFRIAHHECKEGDELTVLALAEGVQAKRGIRPNKERRKLTAHQRQEFEKFFDTLRTGSRRYSDPLWVIDTFSFWEGVDDEMADVQCVVDILEHQWDVDAALRDIKSYARHAALICVKPDFRDKDYWRDTIARHFMITDEVEGGGRISFVANVKTLIPGAKIVVAGTEESRWENIRFATATYTDHVQEAPKHERRALIACYGPSLKDTWPHLKEQAQDENCDVVSVSGAHDYLLDKGITPRFHIECDPRPHKADNIKEACPETEYLLSSNCHPRLFERVAGGKIRLWHSVSGQEAIRIIEELKSKAPLIFGGGSVGLRAIPVMFRMGYRDMSVYGMDCSYSGNDKWAGPHAQKKDHKEKDACRVRYNGREWVTSGILLSYGTDFFDMVNRMLRSDPSLQVRLFGDGLLQARANGPQLPIEIVEFLQAAA